MSTFHTRDWVAVERSDKSVRWAQIMPPDSRYLSKQQETQGYVLVRTNEKQGIRRVKAGGSLWAANLKPHHTISTSKKLGGWIADSKRDAQNLSWLSPTHVNTTRSGGDVIWNQPYTWVAADGFDDPDAGQQRRCESTSGRDCRKVGAVWYPVTKEHRVARAVGDVQWDQPYTWIPADGPTNPDAGQRRRCERTSRRNCRKIGAVWYPLK